MSSWSHSRRVAALVVLSLAGSVARPGAAPAALAATTDAESTLTLAVAVERALGAFPSLDAARAGYDEARAASKEAAAAFLPTLAVRSDAMRYQEPSLVTPIHGFSPDLLPAFNRTVVQSSLSATLTLLDGGVRGNRLRSTREVANASAASLDAARQSLVTQTVSAYLAVAGSSDLLEAQDRRLEALRAERARVRGRLDVGTAARVDLLRIDAEVASAEADRVKTAAALDDAERQLARLTGLGEARTRAARLERVALADSGLAPRETWIETARSKSPALLEAHGRRLAADAARRSAGAARWPELKAVGAYTDWRDFEGDDALEWSAGLRLSLPLFTGGALGQRIAQARAAADGADARARLVDLETRQAVDRAYSAVTAARARVESLERAVAGYEEVARIEALQLQAGAGTQTDYLRGEADLLAARAGWIEARNGEITARAELARVAGILDLNWLTSRLEVAR